MLYPEYNPMPTKKIDCPTNTDTRTVDCRSTTKPQHRFKVKTLMCIYVMYIVYTYILYEVICIFLYVTYIQCDASVCAERSSNLTMLYSILQCMHNKVMTSVQHKNCATTLPNFNRKKVQKHGIVIFLHFSAPSLFHLKLSGEGSVGHTSREIHLLENFRVAFSCGRIFVSFLWSLGIRFWLALVCRLLFEVTTGFAPS